MKRLLFFLAIGVCAAQIQAAKYYVSNQGSDSNNGTSSTSPWKTISKVNTEMGNYGPGDQILFKCGDTFEGQITISASGSSNGYLTFGSYGTGELPVIKGTKEINVWSEFTSGVYSATVSGYPDRITNLFTDDVFQPLSRYPNDTWRKTTANTNDLKLKDGKLDFPDGYWNGADAVVRMARWIIDAVPIKSHVGTVLNFTEETTYGIDKDWGYFFQNHVNAIDLEGEWAYDKGNSKFYYKPKDGINPNDTKVEATYYDFGVLANYEDYLRIENLAFFSPRLMGIKIEGSEYVQIENVKVFYSGGNGIQLEYCNHANVDNCEIRNSLNNGVNFESTSYSSFTNSLIKNAALIPGRGGNLNSQYLGFKIEIGTDLLVENNVLDSIGYCGINFFDCSRTTIKNNFVNYSCLVKDDGGGIYTWGNTGNILDEDDLDNRQKPENKVIGNIVLNSIGNAEGIPDEDSYYLEALGIYIDDYTEDIEIIGNVAANCSEGLFVHNTNSLMIKDNLLYNNDRQINFKEDIDNWAINNCVITNNQFISTQGDDGQVCININSSYDITGDNVFDSNYICNPFYDVLVERIYVPEGGSPDYPESDYLEFDGWQALGKGVHSKPTVIKWEDAGLENEDDLFFFDYNATNDPKEVQLYNAYRDQDNNLHYGTITLEPFSAVVLLRDTKAVLMETNDPEGSTTLCQGAEETTTYTTDEVEEATTYDWSIYPLSAGEINGSGTEAEVTWNSNFSGEVKIGVTACTGDGCGIPAEPLTVTITATPKANFDMQITEKTITLEDLSSDHTSCEWSFGDGNTSTDHEPSYTYSIAGEYEVELIVINKGCSSELVTKAAIIAETIEPIGMPTGDTELCQGEVTSSEYKVDTVDDATSYTWNLTPETAGTIEGNGTSAIVTWNKDFVGTAKITTTACIDDNCGEESDPLVVVIKNTPVASFESEVDGQDVKLTNKSTNWTSSKWDFDDGNYSDNEHAEHRYALKGMYVVKLSVENNGCEGAVAHDTVHIETGDGVSSILEGSVEELKLYPNPSDGMFTLSVEQDFDKGIMNVYNMQGVLVYSSDLSLNMWDARFDLSWLNKGNYIIRVTTTQHIFQTIMVVN